MLLGRRPLRRPEEEEMTQSAQCRGLRPTFPAYLRTLSMRIPSSLIRSGIRELLAQYPMVFLAHSLPLSTSPSSPISQTVSRTVAERNYTLPKACLLDRLNARPSNVVSCFEFGSLAARRRRYPCQRQSHHPPRLRLLPSDALMSGMHRRELLVYSSVVVVVVFERGRRVCCG